MRLYAQDKWKIRSNLTLTYGLRWEYSSPITHRNNFISNFDPTFRILAQEISLAPWSLPDSGLVTPVKSNLRTHGMEDTDPAWVWHMLGSLAQ